MHILFVDDMAETRDLFRLGFTLKGHTTETAHNGPEALRLLEEKASSYDVIFLDYHMPQMTGLEVVERLRAMDGVAQPPIILFTGNAKGILEEQSLQLGVARIAYKPILPDQLLAMAAEVIG